jgi:hypothetical protein
MGARLAGPGVGFVAGFLQAISPLAVGSSCRLLSDSLYAFVFTAAILLMIAYIRGERWRTLLASAVALGAASYVRPVGLAMGPIFALAVLLRTRARHDPPTFQAPVWGGIASRALARLARAAAFLAVFAACIAPWVIRNGIRADYWGFSSAYGNTLFEFAAPRVIRDTGEDHYVLSNGTKLYLSPSPWNTLGYYPVIPEIPEGAVLDSGNSVHSVFWVSASGFWVGGRDTPGVDARWRRAAALEIIAAHPWTYAKLHAKGSVAFWLPATDVLEIAGLTEGGRGTLGVLQDQGLWAAIGHYFGDNWKAALLAVPITIFTFVQYLAGLLCAVRGVRRARFRLPAEVWLLALVVLVSAAMPGVVAHPRFRVPVEPILNVAAAAGLVGLLRRRPSGVPAA